MYAGVSGRAAAGAALFSKRIGFVLLLVTVGLDLAARQALVTHPSGMVNIDDVLAQGTWASVMLACQSLRLGFVSTGTGHDEPRCR